MCTCYCVCGTGYGLTVYYYVTLPIIIDVTRMGYTSYVKHSTLAV